MEGGRRNISLESIEKLALALETPISKLLPPNPSSAKEAEYLFPDEFVDNLSVEDRTRMSNSRLGGAETARITNRVHVVRDGVEALHFLFCTGRYSERSFINRPRLILLDLGLPKIGGLEVLRRIKADHRTC